MGLYKRKGSAVWWCRFQVAGHEIKRSTRTEDRRAAAVEERRLRSLYEAQAPRRRAAGRLTLADLGGKDCARAEAAGATPEHVETLASQWEAVVTFFGADALPTVISHDSVEGYIISRRKSVTGQTIIREVQAIKRGCAIAHRLGAMPVIPQTWPKVRRNPIGKRKGRLHPPHVLAAWLFELPQDARDEAEIAALTGLRAAELKRLAASWVEPASAELQAEGVATVLRVPAPSAKARKERVLPLPPRALEIIRRRAIHVENYDAPVLFQGSHMTARTLARKRIGYKTPISLRDLRHTLATLTNRVGGIAAARDVMGHESIATTNRYISGDLLEMGRAALAIDEIVGTAKSAHVGKTAQMKRATRLELATFSLGS